MTQIEGRYRAWSGEDGRICIVLDLGDEGAKRFDLEPGLNAAPLWAWLDERVRPPEPAEKDKVPAGSSDAYIPKSGPMPRNV